MNRTRWMFPSFITLLCLLMIPGGYLWATSSEEQIEQAGKRLEEDIEDAREELSRLDREVSDERADMRRGIDRIEQETDQLQEELEEERRAAGKLDQEGEDLDRASDRHGEVFEFILSATEDYRRNLGAHLSGVGGQMYGDELEEIDRKLDSESEKKRLGTVEDLLNLSREHVTHRSEGHVIEGKGLDKTGMVHEGDMLMIGPFTYFHAPSLTGVAFQRSGAALPSVYEISDSSGTEDGIARLAGGKRAEVPVDVTGGSAIEFADTRDSLMEHLRKGGITMIPLLGLAALCLVVGLYKFVTLHRLESGQSGREVEDILALLEGGRVEAAREEAGNLGVPLGPVIQEGVQHAEAPKEHVEEIMYERLLSQIPLLEKYLTVLAVGASAAPLLGLLGTVTGMIRTFDLITVFGTGDAGRLSEGISEALVTTEFGLIIAVPALLMHAYLARKVKKTISNTQQAAIMFVNGLKLKA